MGGKALNHLGIHTERKNTTDFFRIYNEISKKLNASGITCDYIKFYHEKETHGDLDILIKIDSTLYNSGINLENWITDNLKTKGISRNSSIVSFEYDRFQIDFIPMSEKYWDSCKCFFDFDPIGNLTGKIAHKFGLKFGFHGLEYPYRNFNGKISTNIQISTDTEKIFNFLGLDYSRYTNGFNTLTEIFYFITASKYFNTEAFLFKNLNSIDRKRNAKRKTYNEFLTYINTTTFTLSNFVGFKGKSEYIEDINLFFPESNFKIKLKELELKNTENELMCSKFNGKLIMEQHPKLMGKELGDAITKFKKSFGDKWREYNLNNSSESILKDFDDTLV